MTDRNQASAEAYEAAFHELADTAYKRLLSLRRLGCGDLLPGDAEDCVMPIIKELTRIDTLLAANPSDARLILAMAGDVVIQLAVLLIRSDALPIDIPMTPPPDLPLPRLISS
ncbi:MAG: hypothetical protein ABI609_01080 [Acidobacteriota bacterium]